MSHAPETAIVCPNCNYPTQRNYCAECGQPTHLHNETFLAMVGHFFAHYFHYESKFWQTLITLWTKPGELTIAYRKKQIARYTAPMSLYIFVVAASMLISISCEKAYRHIFPYEAAQEVVVKKQPKSGSALSTAAEKTQRLADLANKMDKDEKADQFMQGTMPKIMFFMVPVLALFISIFFIGRPGFNFADHIIFSLHIHSFLFSTVFLLPDLLGFTENIRQYIFLWVQPVAIVYIVIAINRVYGSGWLKAICCSVICYLFYFVFLLATILSIAYFLM